MREAPLRERDWLPLFALAEEPFRLLRPLELLRRDVPLRLEVERLDDLLRDELLREAVPRDDDVVRRRLLVLRRRPVERCEAGISAVTTAFVSCGISFSR